MLLSLAASPGTEGEVAGLLVAASKDMTGELARLHLSPGHQFIIGRSLQADLCLRDVNISRQQAVTHHVLLLCINPSNSRFRVPCS